MISVDISIDRDIFDALTEALATAPSRFNRAYTRELEAVRVSILDRLRFTPPKPKYPLRWTSERQRRAFFATRGFGKGIPYRRTGALNAAWRAEYDATDDGGLFRVFNNDPAYPFVLGDRQQGFHRDTGWLTPNQQQDIIADGFVQAENTAIDLWGRILDL